MKPSDVELNEAVKALFSGNTGRARELVDRLLSKNPAWPPAVHFDGLVAKAEGHWSRAEDRFRESLTLPGVTGQARAEYANNLGNLLRQAGYPAAAESAYKHGLEAFNLKRLRTGLATVLLELDRPDEALSTLLKLQSSQFGDENDLILLAECLAKTGDPSAAVQTLVPASNATPVSEERQLAIARFMTELRRDTESEALFTPLLNGRLDTEARLGLVELYSRQNDWARALMILGVGLERDPNQVDLLRSKASIDWMMGNSEEFAAGFTRAIERRPDDRMLRLAMADVLNNAGRGDHAEALLRDGVARHPHDPIIFATLARHLAEIGRGREAIGLAEQSLRAGAEIEMVRESAAIVALASSNIPAALEHTAWLIDRRVDGQFAWALRGCALRLARDPEATRLVDPETVCRAARITPPTEFGSIESFNRELAERLRHRHTMKAHPLVNSVRDGTQIQIHPATETDPLVRALIGMFMQAVEQFAGEMPADSTHPLFRRKRRSYRIAGCWSVLLKGGSGRHVSHVHPQGWLSSAYYVAVPSEVTGSASRKGWLSFGKPSFDVPGLGPVGWVKPEVGHLALFPSYQWHGVEPFDGSGERLTVAFDVVPTFK